MAEISNLSLGGRDFVFIKERGLLFVAMSEMKITSRMDSYITNVSTLDLSRLLTNSLDGHIVHHAMGKEQKDFADELGYSDSGCCLLHSWWCCSIQVQDEQR